MWAFVQVEGCVAVGRYTVVYGDRLKSNITSR